jgi:hypothetical protein
LRPRNYVLHFILNLKKIPFNMRKKLLLSLILAGALPLMCAAKDELPSFAQKKQLHFLENKGQVKDQNNNPRNDIQFSVPGNGISLFVGDGQLHYQFYKAISERQMAGTQRGLQSLGKKAEAVQYSMYRMDVELLGANKHAQVTKEKKDELVMRYYTVQDMDLTRGNTRKGERAGLEVRSYDKISYKDIYPNIDWVMYIKEGQVEYEFVVRPGGNPSDIKLKYSGASTLNTNADGSLTATTPMGTVSEAAPYSYQADGQTVSSSYKLEGDVLSFHVGTYTGTLTIDPTLIWGTYYGGAGDEEYNSVCYDGSSNLYACGVTTSTGNIATVGANQVTFGGLSDIFISKFSSTGTLQWTTYNGGPGNETGTYIAYDAVSGGPYIAGFSDVLGSNDAYIAQYNATGGFVWDDLFGSNTGDDVLLSVECDALGNQYIAGYTNSTTGIASLGTIQTTNFGGYDGHLSKYDALGNFAWGSYYGGTGTDIISSINVDGTGNVHCAGATTSTANISTINTYFGGASDAFLTKINNNCTVWIWGNYYGGPASDEGNAAEVDGSGNIYTTGYTASTTNITNGAFQGSIGGGQDAFIAKHNTNGSVLWSSYYGGSGTENGFSVSLSNTDVFVGGYTASSNLNVTGGYQTTFGGVGDGFMAKVSSTGTFGWGSFYGGTADDAVNSIALGSGIAFYCAGVTGSTSGIALNTTVQPALFGSIDAFISQFNDCSLPVQPSAISGATTICAGSSQTYSVTAVTGLTYTWTLPTGWTGNSTTNSINVTAGTTGGTISVTANNTCGASTPQTLNVLVNPSPTATVTPAGPTTFCQGGSVVLNASTGTGYAYQWFQGTNLLSGQTSASYTASTAGSYTVVITANGCTDTSSAVTVTVNPTPNISASSNSPVCVGTALNFNGGSTTSGVTYDWTGPNNFPNTEDPVIANAQASDAGTYTLTVTDGNNCTATATVTVIVANGAPATPTGFTGLIAVCANSAGNIYSVTNDVNAAQYNWTLPTGWSGTSTTNSITTTAGAAGNVQISVTAQNNCGTSAAATYNVTVHPLPTATISQSGNTLSTTTTFNSYQWYDGTGPISGATSQSYTPTTSGSYYVIVIDGNGCQATSNPITVTVGVNNVSKAGNVELYPNPNNGSFTLKGIFEANNGKVNLEVLDIAGRVVHKQQGSVKAGQFDMKVEMNTGLASGVYTLKLSSDAQTVVVPFVKK